MFRFLLHKLCRPCHQVFYFGQAFCLARTTNSAPLGTLGCVGSLSLTQIFNHWQKFISPLTYWCSGSPLFAFKIEIPTYRFNQRIPKLSRKTATTTTLIPLLVAPAQVLRGSLSQAGNAIAPLGKRPLIVGGSHTLNIAQPFLQPVLKQQQLIAVQANYEPECSENSLKALKEAAKHHQADFIIGIGGGKALDTAKILAHQCQLPVVTIPTSGATCAAWTALGNIYSQEGAFQYDVALNRCPDLLILDYDLIQTAPPRTLIAGIGDGIAKWYEASVSSGHSTSTLMIAAVQQARVLRDILLQKSLLALENPGSEDWREVVDATVLLAGVIGGLGGANCRTVAAHGVHNGLTHIPAAHQALHGEKVAYGILVQLRLEEMVQGNQLAVSARQQLLKFYTEIGLPQTLEDLGLQQITLAQLRHSAEVACHPNSDIHRLPFAVLPEQLMAAMVSTTEGLEKKQQANRQNKTGGN